MITSAVCLPMSLLSLYLIRLEKVNLSTILILLEMHIGNMIVSHITNRPLVAICGFMTYPFLVSALTPDLRLHFTNLILCLLEFIYHSYRTIKIFEVTLNEEQYRQILSILTGTFCYCITAVVVSIIQKRIEINIWKIALENHVKSENLTKEVVQAMEAKDTFVSMLSHEIRNPLNALKGSIDYLLNNSKDRESLQVLKNAKMSGDILLNLVNNILDAAKLKSDKMDIIVMETDVIEIVKKVFIINSEKFKEKRLFAKAFIDKNVPKLMWVDPSRLIQILMNLVSNAVKFTPNGGKINMYVAWCLSNEQKKDLLTPVKKTESDGISENYNVQSVKTLEDKTEDIIDEFNL